MSSCEAVNLLGKERASAFSLRCLRGVCEVSAIAECVVCPRDWEPFAGFGGGWLISVAGRQLAGVGMLDGEML